MSVTKIKTTAGWQDISVPTRSGIIAVQSQVGNNANYVAVPANGVALKRDASNDLQLVFTPSVDCYWETEGHCGRFQKTDSLWHYLTVDLRISPADADGKTTSDDYIIETHKDGVEYGVARPKERWRLTAGTTYTVKMHKADQEGGTYTYYQGAQHLLLSGKAFVVDSILSVDPGPTTVTALPTSPVNGQEVYLQTSAMATQNVMWHLRAKPPTGWHFVGGAPLEDEQIASQQLALGNNTWSGIGVDDPTLTVPVTGLYDLISICTLQPITAACTVMMGLRINSTDPTADVNTAGGYAPVTSARQSLTYRTRRQCTAGDVIAQRYWQNGGTNTVARMGASLTMIPVLL